MGRTYQDHYLGRKMNAREIKRAIIDLDFGSTKIVSMSLQNFNSEAYVVFEGRDGKNHMAIIKVYNDINSIGTKCMGEEEMPYYFKCPISYLRLLSETDNEQAKIWRRNAKAYATFKRMKNKGHISQQKLTAIHNVLCDDEHPLYNDIVECV